MWIEEKERRPMIGWILLVSVRLLVSTKCITRRNRDPAHCTAHNCQTWCAEGCFTESTLFPDLIPRILGSEYMIRFCIVYLRISIVWCKSIVERGKMLIRCNCHGQETLRHLSTFQCWCTWKYNADKVSFVQHLGRSLARQCKERTN